MAIQPDYIAYVMAVYHKKIAENDISGRLIDPSPAQLRDACLAECRKGYSRLDERMLADFFGPAADQEAYLKLITNCDIDRFRPLINYLKKDTGNTKFINIELLAWLIAAPHRHYQPATDYVRLKAALETCLSEQPFQQGDIKYTKEETPVQTATNDAAKQTRELVLQESETKNEPDRGTLTTPLIEVGNKAGIIAELKQLLAGRKMFMSIILAVFVVCAGVFIYTRIASKDAGPQSCMYWAGDHYEQISCSQKLKGVLVIAFDSARHHDFKRITTKDTITHGSIGHVWYSKINNEVQFYTSDGNHPVQINYKLHPATAYMIDMYAKKTE